MALKLLEVCRSCLSNGCELSDKTVDPETMEIILHKNKLRFCFPDMTFEEHTGYTLCLPCSTLLENAYILKKQMLESQNAYKRYIKGFTLKPANPDADRTIENGPNVAIKTDDTATNPKRSKTKAPKSQVFNPIIMDNSGDVLMIVEDINANECSAKSPPKELVLHIPNVNSSSDGANDNDKEDFFIQTAKLVQVAEDSIANNIGTNEDYVILDEKDFSDKFIDVGNIGPDGNIADLETENEANFNPPKKDIEEEFMEDIEIFYACTEETLEETLLNNTSNILHQDVNNENNSDDEGAVDLLFKDYMKFTNEDEELLTSSIPQNEIELIATVNDENENETDETVELMPAKTDQPQVIPAGRKALFCKYCGKLFTHTSSVIRHERIHTGIKPFACKYCDKCFKQSSDLTTHERTHTGLKPHACTLCDKTFLDAANLTKHKRVHSGERPYICKYCKKSFRTLTSVIRHERIHTGEKPYSCKICSKAFRNISSLQHHSKAHHKPVVGTVTIQQ